MHTKSIKLKQSIWSKAKLAANLTLNQKFAAVVAILYQASGILKHERN